MTNRVKIIVPHVSDSLLQGIEAYAAEHNISRNHVVVEGLLDRYSLKHPDTKPPYREHDGTRPNVLSVEVPTKIREKLRVEAARKGATISGIVRATLAEKLGLPEEDMYRRPRGSRSAA